MSVFRLHAVILVQIRARRRASPPLPEATRDTGGTGGGRQARHTEGGRGGRHERRLEGRSTGQRGGGGCRDFDVRR